MSWSAREGVEQYSRAIQPASATRSAPTPAPITASGSTRRSGSSSERSASSTTTPSELRAPNGTRSSDPTSTSWPGARR